MLISLPGFSLEPPPSEVEFLRRELGIEWRQITKEELHSRLLLRAPLLLLVSEPDGYREFLEASPDGSLVLLLISDEAYSPERLNLAGASAVSRTYRHYPARHASGWRIASAASGYVRDSARTSQSATTFLPNVASGLSLRGRMKDWEKLGDRVRSVPLGYTDTFASAFAELMNLGPTESLFSYPIDEDPRPTFITFHGNRGLAQRISGLELAGRLPHSDVVTVDADWSARAPSDVGTSYVESLMEARFALCPPGFANNESFRFYEALICGALPVEVTTATTHLGELPWRSAGTIAAASWTRSLREAERMSESTREARLMRVRTLIARELAATAEWIRRDLED